MRFDYWTDYFSHMKFWLLSHWFIHSTNLSKQWFIQEQNLWQSTWFVEICKTNIFNVNKSLCVTNEIIHSTEAFKAKINSGMRSDGLYVYHWIIHTTDFFPQKSYVQEHKSLWVSHGIIQSTDTQRLHSEQRLIQEWKKL